MQSIGPSSSGKAYPGCREAIREAFLRKKAPVDSLDIILASLEESTLKQYNSTLKEWWKFCGGDDIDPLDASAENVLAFLSKRFQGGAKYGVLNSARAALALISSGDISNNLTISRFIRGAYKQRPSKPRYETTWDVDPVLEALGKWYPLDSLDRRTVSMKLVLLLALGTGQRLQTLAAMKIQNIEERTDRLEVKISDRLKTSRIGTNQPVLVLPHFKDKPELCISRTLLYYLKITKPLRDPKEKYVFISINKPHRRVSTDTIGRWLKAALSELGVPDSFRAHSTRHASTSKAAERGVAYS